MPSARLLRIVVVAVALLLHLAAHVGLGEPRVRQPLPEDRPALLANRALAPEGEAPLADALRAALTDPAVAWDPGGDVVGRTRFRPVAMAVFAVERALGGDRAGWLVGVLSLLLHVVVALSAAGLALDVSGSLRASWLAGLITAAAPVALSAAAWPARQPVVLAAALGVVGIRLALRGGIRSHIAAGVVLACAGLAHELAYGATAAAAVFVLLRRNGATQTSGSSALASSVIDGAPRELGPVARLRTLALIGVPVVAAIVWRSVVLSSTAPGLSELEAIGGGDGVVRPDIFDAAAGALLTLLAPLLPTRLHLAGGPWLVGGAARLASGLLLVGATYSLARRWRAPNTAPCLAALAFATPLLFSASTGGAPFHDAYAYVLLPVLATAVGVVLARAVRSDGALRLPATVAGALLVGASVAATLTSAAEFRSSKAFVELADRGDPGSAVVEAWRLGNAVAAAPAAVLIHATGADEDARPRADALLALLPQALALADRLLEPGVPGRDAIRLTTEGRRIARDGAAALSIASVLSGYATAVAALPAGTLRDDDTALLPEIIRPAEAAVAVAPQWSGAWLVLAQTCTRVGAIGAALEAARSAVRLDPNDVARAELLARLALRVGRTTLAVSEMERASVLEAAAAEDEDRLPRRAHVLLRGEALSADASASGVLVEFDWAARLLQPRWDAGDRDRDLRTLLYNLYLRWGDALASLDKTAMASLAYDRAVALGGTGSGAAEHRGWLTRRLRREMNEAVSALKLARSGEGNIANALLGVAIVLCRSAKWSEADELFEQISRGQGGMNPALRFARAVHRYAARDDELGTAEQEFRRVLDEDSAFVSARFELAGVLVQSGRLEDARREFLRAAAEGAAYEWSAEALQIARHLENLQRSSTR